MARVCQVTGKRTQKGYKVARRGLSKKSGGVGLKTTGRTKRTYKPNLQTVRVLDPDGRLLRLKISTRVLKKGVIELERGGKVVRFPLVKALRGRNRAFSGKSRPAAEA
ncbi:MAG: 50S ribosomal protein L28 [Planctomycetota bacterium]